MIVLLMAVNIFLSLLEYSVIIECVCSWIPQMRESGFYRVLTKINGPFVNPFRFIFNKLFPGMMVDFSPVAVIIIIGVIKSVI